MIFLLIDEFMLLRETKLQLMRACKSLHVKMLASIDASHLDKYPTSAQCNNNNNNTQSSNDDPWVNICEGFETVDSFVDNYYISKEIS